jgi:predicted small lipoprotein YifL
MRKVSTPAVQGGLPPASALSAGLASLVLALAGLSGCGGGNPLGNPPDVSNQPTDKTGQEISFVYYQRCIDPIHQTTGSGSGCANSGCHIDNGGPGGTLRIQPNASSVTTPASMNDADKALIRRTEGMYKNYFSSADKAVPGSPDSSSLLRKPLLLVSHTGGQVFSSAGVPNATLMSYWISHPMPAGEDEFSSAADALFVLNDPINGACKT